MNLYTLIVDDNTHAFNSEDVIEFGNIQGKYTKGERWVISTERFYTFPGAMYIVGVYNHGKCYTRPVYINLPLNDCKYDMDGWFVDIVGDVLSFDATSVEMGDSVMLVMRGNTMMETQYYAHFQHTDEEISPSELFVEENYIGL